MRVRLPGETSLIVKTRKVANLTERLKSLAGASNPHHEFRVHRLVAQAGLCVPRPLQFFSLYAHGCGYFEVIVMEDLGRTTNGLVFLKQLISRGAVDAAERFESHVIEQTRLIIQAKIVDIDHQLRNFVIDQNERVHRIDLECARHWRMGRMPVAQCGAMLGRLVCSHVFACHPDITQSVRFADKIAEALAPPPVVLQHANEQIKMALRRQTIGTGISSEFRMSW
jgi:hypothetical protein